MIYSSLRFCLGVQLRCVLLLAAITLATPVARLHAHDVHISSMRLQMKGNRIEAQLRVYRDDFALALEDYVGKSIRTASIPDVRQAIYACLRKHIVLSVNGDGANVRTVLPDITGIAREETMYRFDLSFKLPASHNAVLKLRNTLLLDRFSDQRTLVTVVQSNGETTSRMIDRSDRWCKVPTIAKS